LEDASAEGDRIRVVIRGSAINQDGDGWLDGAPNGAAVVAQHGLFTDALKRAGGLSGGLSTLLEAHGTGNHHWASRSLKCRGPGVYGRA